MNNKRGYKWYVVNVQKICIDSGWEFISDANDRALALGEETSPGAVKVMTKPRVGSVTLDPNDDASWTPKRANPRFGNPAPKAGSLVKKNGTQRVFEVESVDHTSAVICDIVTGECFKVPLDEFVHYTQTNPANIVKTPRDERLWKEAKQSAKSQGRGGDYAYITGIFKRMRDRVGGGELRNPGNWRKGLARAQAANARKAGADPRSGYTQCACRDCFDTTISSDERKPEFCDACLRAGCDGQGECKREDAYGTRENPGELLVVNPSEGALDSHRAEKIYKMWHKKEPSQVSVTRPRIDWEDEFVCVGNAHNIVYRSGKWESGKKTNDYVHHFDSKPKVWMLAKYLPDDVGGAIKTAEQLCGNACNADGQLACAELARPLSFGLDDGTNEGEDIKIHSGAKVLGAIDKHTVIIFDPHWKMLIIKGGKMHFDERGIVK